MLDYIDGCNFSEVASFKIDRDHNDMTTELFRSNAIIFCKTDFLQNLFDFIKISGRILMILIKSI